MKRSPVNIAGLLADIHAKLNVIEERMAWLIKPEGRFRIGQRVEFSRRARKGLASGNRGERKGHVKKIDGFSILVLLDGQKHPHLYHHALFNPVSGPKLF